MVSVSVRKLQWCPCIERALTAEIEKPTSNKTIKARFRRRTFREPNLIHWIKQMKSSASESRRYDCFNLKQLSRSLLLDRLGISPLDRLWDAFDLDAELFMYRTWCKNSYNVFCKQFDRNEHFSPSRYPSYHSLILKHWLICLFIYFTPKDSTWETESLLKYDVNLHQFCCCVFSDGDSRSRG